MTQEKGSLRLRIPHCFTSSTVVTRTPPQLGGSRYVRAQCFMALRSRLDQLLSNLINDPDRAAPAAAAAACGGSNRARVRTIGAVAVLKNVPHASSPKRVRNSLASNTLPTTLKLLESLSVQKLFTAPEGSSRSVRLGAS